VVVHRNRENPFGVLLADDIVVEDAFDLLWAGHAFLGLNQGRLVLFADNIHAELDAFIADEHGRSRDQLADLVLALAAERAVERVLRLSA